MKKIKQNKILIIHGPNLHLLGKREPKLYGKFTLKEINEELEKFAKLNKISIEIFQSNSEGDIVERITKNNYSFLIINPAAYTHTSVAIRDAILAIDKPTIEVHLSNIYKREEFRKTSLINDVVIGTISGLGQWSYFLALEASIAFLNKERCRK